MYETDYTRLLPQEPPEGLADWLKKNGKLGGDYIIYKCGTALNPDTGKNVRVVDCHCTACNKTFPAEYEPYYTLEYDFDRMCIVQNRGYKNQAPPKEVKAFAEEWNEYIKDMSQKKNRLKNERSAA